MSKEKLLPFESVESTVYLLEDDGRIFKSTTSNKKQLWKGLNKLSREYYYIEDIGNDHYIFGDFVYNGFFIYDEEIDMSKVAFKYGIFALKRNKKGEILPMQEEVIAPAVFDRISTNNLRTVTVYGNNNHLSYFDIDPYSPNYGKLLVPVILEHAVPFSTKYEGFAECSIDGVCGYLPRNCRAIDEIEASDLLTEDEVKCILPAVTNEAFDSAFEHYSTLTDGLKLRLK